MNAKGRKEGNLKSLKEEKEKEGENLRKDEKKLLQRKEAKLLSKRKQHNKTMDLIWDNVVFVGLRGSQGASVSVCLCMLLFVNKEFDLFAEKTSSR